MDSVVLKFGGTSVQDAAALRRLVGVVAAEPRRRVIVVSALAGVTDVLCELASGAVRGAAAGETMHRLFERHVAIVRELVAPQTQRMLLDRLRRLFEKAGHVASEAGASPASGSSRKPQPAAARDALLATGELASSEVVVAVLAAAGVPASWVDARDIIVTDATFGSARPDPTAIREAARRHLEPLLAGGRVPVLPGFIGSTGNGATTTLGRGGSDYSAALVGAAISAQEIQIWTDVDGVLTSDPRLVPDAALVPELSFHEAYDLARFGAKVLHWGTLEPAASHGIPVRVLNSQRPGSRGTTITGRVQRPAPSVVGLAQQTGVTVADVRTRGVAGSLRFLQTALDSLARETDGVNVISLSASRLVTIASDEGSIQRLLTAVDGGADARVVRDAAIVAAVGEGISGHAAVWSVLTAAAYAGHVESVVATHSGHALVCVTTRALAPRLLSYLHDAFFGFAGRKRGRPPRTAVGSDPMIRGVTGGLTP